MAVQKQDDQLELTSSNYVRTQDVTPKTCRRRWMIGGSGERGSGISVLAAPHDDDDDDNEMDWYSVSVSVSLYNSFSLLLYVCVCVQVWFDLVGFMAYQPL